MKPAQDRTRQQQRHEKVPEMRAVVQHMAPQLWEEAREAQKRKVPEEWRALLTQMRGRVRTQAETANYHAEDASRQMRVGYHWSFEVERVADMLDHLTNAILEDIGFEAGTTLASIGLLQKSMLQLQLELQDGGTKKGREDRLENRYRRQEALKALSPHFDDLQMKRLRALQVAGWAARLARIPTPQEVKQYLRDIAEHTPSEAGDEEKHKTWVQVDQPTMVGVMVQSSLVEVSDEFATLDPLVVLEEFAEARGAADGAREDGGEGRTGPARALARLAVMCGALGFEQRDGEDFDDAVQRARSNLLVTRSRIKKAILSFPTAHADGADLRR